MTLLAAGPLRPLDHALQGYWAKRYTPNWFSFLDSVPNAVAGQAVCLPVLLFIAVVLARKHRTWHPLAIVVAAEVAFYVGVGGMKVLLGRTSPAAGAGHFWEGGLFAHGWYGIAYPSGHAAEAILFYGAAAYLLRTYAGPDVRIRKRLTFLVALITANAIVVAFYLGFHWPTDLLGGMLAGALMLRIIVDLDRRIAAGRTVMGWLPPTVRTATTARAALGPDPKPVLALPHRETSRSPAPAVARSAESAVTQRAHDLPPVQPAAVRTVPLRPGAVPVSPLGRTLSSPFALPESPTRTHLRPRSRARQLQSSSKG